jgi:hypothetical protein
MSVVMISSTACTALTTRAEALFASPLQPSDHPSAAQINQAITTALLNGTAACACTMAAEFGEHPECAYTRMQWALATAAATPER